MPSILLEDKSICEQCEFNTLLTSRIHTMYVLLNIIQFKFSSLHFNLRTLLKDVLSSAITTFQVIGFHINGSIHWTSNDGKDRLQSWLKLLLLLLMEQFRFFCRGIRLILKLSTKVFITQPEKATYLRYCNILLL